VAQGRLEAGEHEPVFPDDRGNVRKAPYQWSERVRSLQLTKPKIRLSPNSSYDAIPSGGATLSPKMNHVKHNTSLRGFLLGRASRCTNPMRLA
jgi:hypothetical protein